MTWTNLDTYHENPSPPPELFKYLKKFKLQYKNRELAVVGWLSSRFGARLSSNNYFLGGSMDFSQL